MIKFYANKDKFEEELGAIEEGQEPSYSTIEEGTAIYNGDIRQIDDSEVYLEDGQEVVLYLLNDGEIYGYPVEEKEVIRRVIFVDSKDEIDLTNIGVHWTRNPNYTHKGGGSNGGTPEGELMVTFLTSDFVADDYATEFSNVNYPHEQEVVLEEEQDLIANIVIEDNWGVIEIMRGVEVNIGTRSDGWVKNL